MLFQLRKKNIELNDEYNRIINEKVRFEVEYQKMKKRVKKFEEKEKRSENRELLEVFVESVRNTSNVSDQSSFQISLFQRSYSTHQSLSTKRT
jgi:hypothetical protein